MLICNKLAQPRQGGTLRISVHLFAIALLMGFAGAPAFGQAEYSDAYSIDDSGQAYDAATDTVYIPDSAPLPQMVGIGVSEDSYDSETYSTSTYTTLTSPDGRVISGSSDGYIYARAKAFSLELDPQTTVEGDYTVNSEHTYYREQVEPEPCSPSGICTVSKSGNLDRALFTRAAFKPSAPPWFFFRRFTFFVFFVRPVAIAYRWANTTVGCAGDPNRPWEYLLHCPNAPAPCARARVCAGGAAPFVQGFGLRIHFGFAVVCHMRYPYYAPTPWCF